MRTRVAGHYELIDGAGRQAAQQDTCSQPSGQMGLPEVSELPGKDVVSFFADEL